MAQALDQLHVWFLAQSEPVMMVVLGLFSLPAIAFGAIAFVALPAYRQNPEAAGLLGRLLSSRPASTAALALVAIVGISYGMFAAHLLFWPHSEA